MTLFTSRSASRPVAIALAGLAAVTALSACGSSASNSVGAATPTADIAGVCQQLTGKQECGLTLGTSPTPTSNQLPANTAPRGQAAAVLHLYFGEFYSLSAGRRYVYDGVAGTFTLAPGSAGPNSGTFQMQEGFTQGLSMEYFITGAGTYTYSPASDVYEFQFSPGQFAFGTGTLTAANGQLIGTLTVDGNISTTFAIPYTTA